MNEPIEIPSRALKIWVAVTGGLFWFLVAAWLCFFAAWGALHGWIVPRIADFRPRIEAEASKALGVPVQIGAISARSEGLVPSFTLGDVALLDAQGRAALRLPQVVVALSPRSLWNHGFEQLYLGAPELDVRRTADGRILVAGIAISADGADDGGAAADWLFSQTEVVVQNGTVRWTDEQRGAQPLALSQVDIVLRNRPWRHAMRLDATPPASWGERFRVMGRFRQPLLAGHNGRWQDWVGQLHADFTQVDVSQLRQHIDLSRFGVDVASGQGALRAWADVRQRSVAGGVLDLALQTVEVRAAPGLEPLSLHRLQGRLSGVYSEAGFTLAAQGLQFDTDDGTHWPAGHAELRYTAAGPRRAAQGELQAERIDLAALAHIGERLPLAEPVRRALAARAPRGQIENLLARWEGQVDAPVGYQVRGRAVGLAVEALPAPATAPAPAVPGHHVHPPTGAPGLRGASVDFDLSQAGGSAQLAIDGGALEFPGVFEEPVVPVDALRAELRWTLAGSRIAVEVPRLSFTNADAAGEARGSWHTAAGEGAARFPGVLDLTGSLQRADAARVHRYLPQVIAPDVRHYVRDAVQAGRATGMQFHVRGDLLHMPFTDPRQGDFRIAAQIRDATFAYVPASHQPAGQAPWPVLAPLAAELVFERKGMEIRNATGRLGLPGKVAELQVLRADARIPDLEHGVVGVTASTRGPLGAMLAAVNGSPIGGVIEGALQHASATGPAELKLDLSLPLADLHRTRVQGSLLLAGNDLRFTPDSLLLARARGTVAFTEAGFSLSGVQASMLGGDARIEGSMRSAAAAPLTMRVHGTVSAAGLREAAELGFVSRLAAHASGATAYSATIGVREGRPEILLTSSLQGLGLDLPAPLGKSADAVMPLRYENSLLAPERGSARDRVVLELGGAAALRYERDVADGAPRVLRGSIGIGLGSDEPPPLPGRGVAASARLGRFDVDAWEAVLAGAAASPPPAAASGSAVAGPAAGPGGASDYLPDTFAVQADALAVEGRTLHRVVLGGSREGAVWRANVDADELSGYAEYRPAAAGSGARVFARLARLKVPESAASEVETLLDEGRSGGGESVLPALDIVVEDFELKGRRLGRLEIDAVHRTAANGRDREWHLNKLNLAMPEATFAATGDWGRAARAAAGGARHRTVMDFQLDIRDAAPLLARFGMHDVVRRGAGRLQGRVAWTGSPLSPDYPSMAGQLNLNVESGQFLKAEPGLAKLLGVLSLQSLPRRLTLDFRDVFSEGFAFDFVRGDVRIEQGNAHTNNLQMKGVNAAVLMDGQADLVHETQNLRVVVVPEINAGTASLVAAVINPAVGLGTFLAQVFLRGPLTEAATQEFHITGTWTDPKIDKLTGRQRLGRDGNPP